MLDEGQEPIHRTLPYHWHWQVKAAAGDYSAGANTRLGDISRHDTSASRIDNS
jgi:hypothetical protein